MNNFTQEEAKELILSGTMGIYQSRPVNLYPKLFSSSEVSSLPPSILYYYRKYENEKYQDGYLLPGFILELTAEDLEANMDLFVKHAKIAKKHFKNYDARSDAHSEMIKMAKDILLDLLNDGAYVDFSSPKLWQECSMPKSRATHLAYANKFYQKISSISAFQKVLPTDRKMHLSFYFKEQVKYTMYLKALVKEKDYSLHGIPDLIKHRLNTSTSEAMRLESIQALQKYQFIESEEWVNYLYHYSKNEKTLAIAKKIIDDNRYDTPDSDFLSQNDYTQHFCSLEINIKKFHQMTKDNWWVFQAMMQVVISSLRTQYTLDYQRGDTLVFIAKSVNKKDIENFRNDLEQHLDFAFHDFLTPESFKTLSSTHRDRSDYDEVSPHLESFKKGYESYLLKKKLEESLMDNIHQSSHHRDEHFNDSNHSNNDSNAHTTEILEHISDTEGDMEVSDMEVNHAESNDKDDGKQGAGNDNVSINNASINNISVNPSLNNSSKHNGVRKI